MSGTVKIRVNENIQAILDSKVDKGGNLTDTGQTLRDAIDANGLEITRLAGMCIVLNPTTNLLSLTDGDDAVMCSVDLSNFRGVKGYTNLGAFPATGALEVIYIDQTNDATYIWDAETLSYKPTTSDAQIIAALGYTPEDQANKVGDFNVIDNITYPSTKAVDDRLTQLLGQQQNKKIYYVVRHTGGLGFSITAQYVINGVTIGPITQTVTLDPSDTLHGRFDMIVLNADATIGFIKGTPAENPLEPTLTSPESQLKGSFIFIPANATEPDGFTTIKIYDENTGTGGGEFDTQTVPVSNPRINLASAADPVSGAVSIYGNAVDQYDAVLFTPAGPFAFSKGGSIIYSIKNQIAINGTQPLFAFQISGADSNGVVQTVTTQVDPIFDRSNITQYQLLQAVVPDTLPFAEISQISFVILAKSNQDYTFYLDDIHLVEDTGDTVSNPNITEEYIRIQDEKYLDLAKAYADSVGDKHYTFVQATPATVWGPFNHKLNKEPSIDCFDQNGDPIEGEEEHIDLNNSQITYNIPVAGKATCN